MDATFANPKSRHNIHTAKCTDCHPEGVPKKPGVLAGSRPWSLAQFSERS